MKPKMCCFIGHKDLSAYDESKIEKALKEQIKKLIDKGVDSFLSSCRLGFETLAALTVIKMKSGCYFSSNLLLVLPKEEQHKNWSKKDIQKYEYIKKNMYSVYEVEPQDGTELLSQNKHMIDLSSYVIVAFNGEEKVVSHTRAAINYAKEQKKKIIYLDMKNLLKGLSGESDNDSWTNRINYVLEYSSDFSKENLAELMKEYEVDYLCTI